MESAVKIANDNLKHCDFAKTILMLCVIAGHCCGFWTEAWFTVLKPVYSNEYLGYFANWVGSFHVSGFTLISGYIYYYVKNERGGYSSFTVLLSKKAKRLLVPYFFMCVVWVIPITNLFFHYSSLEIVDNYLFGGLPEQLWFLLMLFDVFVLFFFLNHVIDRNLYVGYLILIVLYCIGDFYSRSSILNVFQIFTSFKFLIVFSTGYCIRKYYSIFFCRRHNGLNKIGTLIFLLILNALLASSCQHLLNFESVFSKVICKFLYIILYVCRAITAFGILLYLADRLNWRTRIFNLLLTNNFKMYLFHQQIVYVLLFLFNGLLIPEIHALLNFIISSTLSVLISLLIGRFKYLRVFFGDK